MTQSPINSIVIVGGGTAGWMTATALARVINKDRCSIRLIESEQIGTVGVGEATIPAIHDFNRRMGIDEQEFMRATNATFKLGIQFVNWQKIGDSYMHPFGTYGQDMNGVGFHHYWLKQKLAGDETPFDEYALPWVAAKLGRFKHPVDDARSVYSTYSYAFHFDASLYAAFLRGIAEKLGVERTEGKVVDVHLRPEDGHIKSVELENGERIEGELFIDCSGFRGLLIEGALKTGYEDWRGWLPCDSALAVPTANVGEPVPYTRATAHSAGWQWRIPLQHRTGNGHVYSSAYMSEDAATEILLQNVLGTPQAEPRLLRFTPGKRLKMWNRNCIAIGLSGGFLEPLESTSIFLIQAAIMKLLEYFPDSEFASADVDAYNRSLDTMFDEVRNFIILHYKATSRDDSRFWDYCREMQIPEELEYRMKLFRRRGIATHRRSELFIETNWLAVLLGQGITPDTYDPRADCMSDEQISSRLKGMHEYLLTAATALPSHQASIAEFCQSVEAS
jgi:tryptophan halogenase